MGHFSGLHRYALNEEQTELSDPEPRCIPATQLRELDDGRVVVDLEPRDGAGDREARLGADLQTGDPYFHEAGDCPFFATEEERVAAVAEQDERTASAQQTIAEARETRAQVEAERQTLIEAEAVRMAAEFRAQQLLSEGGN